MQYTREELEALTGPQLVEIFNTIQDAHPNGQRIKKFSSRGAGINRILTIQGMPETKEAPVPQPTGEIEPLVDERPKKRGRPALLRGTYNLEAGPVERPHRANSIRGRIIERLINDGATLEQLDADTPEWDRDQIHNVIRVAASWYGWNITTDEDGVIRATR